MNFYKRNIGDFRKKTARLSALEVGIYDLFLDEIYATEEPLPLDARELNRISRAETSREKAASRKVLERYFTRTPVGWVNERAEEELSEWAEKSGKARASANKRWEAERKSKSNANADANACACGDAIQNPESREKTPVRESSKAKRRGARLPDDWLPNEKDIAFAREKGLDDERIQHCVEQFCDHWRAASGQKAVKQDWHAAWRTWIRNDKTWNGVGRIGATVAGGRRTQREIKREFAGAAQEVLTRVRDRAPEGSGKA